MSGYDIVADIRINDKGKDMLYFDGFKFRKNQTCPNSISWVCCKKSALKCKSMASTKDINGIAMMKWNEVEHNHDPECN